MLKSACQGRIVKGLIMGLALGMMTSGWALSSPEGMSFTQPTMSDAQMVQTVLHNVTVPKQYAKMTLPSQSIKSHIEGAAVGRVVWVKGEFTASLKSGETDQERDLEKASLIYLHDTLKTGMDSQAQIVFSDNTLMTFKPQSKFYVAQYEYRSNSKEKSVGKYVMNLIEGGFRTITGLIAKSNPSDYEVNTPVATIGVRGTDYTVILKGDGIYIARNKGEPCVQSGKKGAGSGGTKTLCLDAKAKYAMVASPGAAPVILPQAPSFLIEPIPVTTVTVQQAGGVSTEPTIGGTSGSGGSDFCIR